MKNPFIKRMTFFFTVTITLLSLVIGCNEQTTRKDTLAIPAHQEDMGKMPWVLDIEEATIANANYRIAKWSGEYMQMVLMSLKPGEIIDLEIHEDHDQFIRVEQGEARVLMGDTEDNLAFDKNVSDDWAIFIPAGYWHQIINTGNTDLKLYTIYAPSEHMAGTVHETYKQASE
jgi:mannose-6-phosphate isomerase-like protein (cupin superfamily)